MEMSPLIVTFQMLDMTAHDYDSMKITKKKAKKFS